MSAKPTPGPWAFNEGDDNDELRVVGANGGYVTACRNVFVNPAEPIANARLIAAAPELLEALTGLLEGVQDIRGIEITDYCRDEVAAAEAAIAKATGAA